MTFKGDIRDQTLDLNSWDGNSTFDNVYISGDLHYDFEDRDLTFKSLNVTGKTILNDDIDLSGNLNVNNDAKITGIATFNNIKVTGQLTDGDGDTGTAGQILSSDGTDLEWINASSANVGSASKIGVNDSSNSTDTMYLTFVDSTSGNEEIRIDIDLKYKPSTGSFLGLTTFTDIKSTSLHVTGGVKDTSGDVGNSGQVLSATGVVGGGTNWINVGDITAGTASSIAVTANSHNKDQFLTFVNENGGTHQLRSDAGAKYNPNTNTLIAGTFSGSGASLTSIPDSAIAALTASKLTGALPAISGASLTGIDAFPSGTMMMFVQTNAPTGWTKSTTNNNRALRIVNGTSGGNQGGNNDFTTAFNSSRSTSGGSVSNHTLTTSQIPSHRHWISNMDHDDGNCTGSMRNPQNQYPGLAADAGSYNINDANKSPQGRYGAYSGGGGSHNHNFSHPSVNLNVKYHDVIIATKD